MIKIHPKFPPKHYQVLQVIQYLNEHYPIANANITFRYDPVDRYPYKKGQFICGYCRAVNETAKVKIASKDSFIRTIAKTTVHEYMHCIQFIQRGIDISDKNRDMLEKEANDFADTILHKIWEEKGIFCPSST